MWAEGLTASLSTSVILGGICTLVGGMGITYVPCMAAALNYILFLLVTPFGASMIFEWDFSALERISLVVDHNLGSESCSLTGHQGRSLGSFLAFLSYLLFSCLACGETLTASLLAGCLMAKRWSSALLLFNNTVGPVFFLESETNTSLLLLFRLTYL